MVVFEHENEAFQMLGDKNFHHLVNEVLQEKEAKVPAVVAFEVLDQYCKGKLKPKLTASLKDLDLVTLKQKLCL